MRIAAPAGLLAILLSGCLTNGISGIGDGTDTTDDMDDADDGVLTPRDTAAFDKSTLATENGKVEMLTVNLTSIDGFAGTVNLTKSLLDGASAVVPGVTVNGPASVDLAANGTGTATFAMTIPANTTGVVLTSSFKVSLSSSAGALDVTSAVTINNFYTVDYPMGTGATANQHPNAGRSIALKRGTIIKFPNHDTLQHIIHGGGGLGGEHEGQTATDGLSGRTYDVPTIGYAPGTSGTLGCHTHGTGSYATYTLQ
jgi:hypothetical protein